MLRDPQTNELVDNGANIPLDQILAGPRRSKLAFEPDSQSEVRGIGQMLRRENAPHTQGRFKSTGRRKGWTSLSGGAHVAYQTAEKGPSANELTIARVIKNLQSEQRVLVQP